MEYQKPSADQPSTSNFNEKSQTTKNVVRLPRIMKNSRIQKMPMVVPRPKKDGQNNQSLIALIDRTEFKEKKKQPYYPELSEIEKEFGVPDESELKKMPTNSDILKQKMQMVQRLRGENKFLKESIKKKKYDCNWTITSVNQIRQSTINLHNECHYYRQTNRSLEESIEEVRNAKYEPE